MSTGRPAPPDGRGGARAGRKSKHAEPIQQIAVRLPVSLVQAIDEEAHKRRCSRADVILA
jgi:hypothetical protein